MKLIDIISIEDFYNFITNYDKTLSLTDKENIIKQIDSSMLNLVPSEAKFTKKEAEALIKRNVDVYKIIKNIKPNSNSIKPIPHNFNWTQTYDLSLEAAQQYRLVKGVAMTEGEAKRGEIMTEANLRYGTGAMAASAMMGFAVLDIDHFPDSLPETGPSGEDYTKYNLEKINEIYPIGMILDAELSKNKVGTEGKELWQIEFIAIVENEFVYDMIKTGTFKACSVMDFPREYSCDMCNSETGQCTCNVSGSKFMYNTLVLEGVPNSDSTWISIVDKKDIGSIVKPHGQNTNEEIENRLALSKLNRNHSITHQINEADVSKYQTDDGVWTDGVASVKLFLMEQKNISEEQADKIAQYIFNNPSALNTDQLKFMSGDDLISWHDNLNMINKAQLHKFIKHLNLKPHSKEEIKKSHVVQLTKEQVNYGPGEDGSLCRQCRWFFSPDEELTDESEGGCQLVEGSILGNQTCDRFEVIPGDEPEPEPDPDADADAETENDTHPPDENGNCDEGFHLSEDGTTCISDTASENTTKQKELDALEAAANIVPTKKTKPKPSALIDTRQTTQFNADIEKIDKEINALFTKRNDLGPIMGRGRISMQRQTEYEEITQEIHRLEALKKK